jgi:hypothetical protein
MRGFFRVLELLAKYTGCEYSAYYADVESELYKLFNKYVNNFGAATSQRVPQPSAHTDKKKQAWGRIFGGPGGSGSGVVGPPPGSSTSSSSFGVPELSAYLDSDCVTSYGDNFDILLRHHHSRCRRRFLLLRQGIGAQISLQALCPQLHVVPLLLLVPNP